MISDYTHFKGKLQTLVPRLVSFHRHWRLICIITASWNDRMGKNDRDGNSSDLFRGSPHPIILGPVHSIIPRSSLSFQWDEDKIILSVYLTVSVHLTIYLIIIDHNNRQEKELTSSPSPLLAFHLQATAQREFWAISMVGFVTEKMFVDSWQVDLCQGGDWRKVFIVHADFKKLRWSLQMLM